MEKRKETNASKTILALAFTNLKSDPRVYRQILSCVRQGYRVLALGLSDPEIEGVDFYKVSNEEPFLKKVLLAILLLFRSYDLYYRLLTPVKQAKSLLDNQAVDLIICNDVETLPLGVYFKSKNTKSKLLFDAHEYAPLEHEDSFVWRTLFRREKVHVLKKSNPSINKMLTVGKGIAARYFTEFGINAVVMTNASDYVHEEKLSQKIDGQEIRLIHHGVSLPARKIEIMIEMMDLLGEGYQLDLMLVKSNVKYHQELEKLAQNRFNVKLITPVPMREIIPFIAQYDVGLYILKPTNFNNKMALPNKIFEFIQARLILAVGPSPEMDRLVSENNVGVVAADFSSLAMAQAIKGISSEDFNRYRNQVKAVAKEINSQKNIQLLNEIVSDLLWES